MRESIRGAAERTLAMKNVKDLSEIRALKILSAAQIMNVIGLFFSLLILSTVIGMQT